MISKFVYLVVVSAIKIFFFLCNIFPLCYRLRITGEKIPTDRPVIISCTHESRLDIISLIPISSIFRWNYFIAKKELWQESRLQAWLFDMVRVIKVDRDSPGKKTIEDALQVLEKNNILIVFPEGTRVKEKPDHWNIEKGVAMIAKLAKKRYLENNSDEKYSPVIYPVAIRYQGKCIKVKVGKAMEIDNKIKSETLTIALSKTMQNLYEQI